MKDKEIEICECGTPLIFTFLWPYKEWFCLSCGEATEFLGRNYTKLTLELRVKLRVVNKIWKSLRSSLLPRTFKYRRNGCKKCDTGEDHGYHVSTYEKRKDKIATQILKNIEGLF